MPSNTKTLQNTLDWAKHFVGQRPLAFPLVASVPTAPFEPAVTSANTVIQSFLQPPLRYRWNRASIIFQTIDPGGWKSNTLLAVGYRLYIGGAMQIVTTGGATGGSQPVWPTTVGNTVTDGGVTWTCNGTTPTDYVQSIPDFGFIEKAYVQDPTGAMFEIPDIKQEMTQDTGTGRASGICPYLDDNQGNITFRFMPGTPDKAYVVIVIYQKQPTLMANLTDVWPIPDRYGMVTNQGFLGFMYLFADDPGKAMGFLQRFMAGLLALAEGLTEQERNTFMEQWNFTIEGARAGAKASQGLQARSAS